MTKSVTNDVVVFLADKVEFNCETNAGTYQLHSQSENNKTKQRAKIH